MKKKRKNFLILTSKRKKIFLEKIGELKNNTGLDLSERAVKQEEKNGKLKNKIKKLMKEIGELEEKKKALMKENKD